MKLAGVSQVAESVDGTSFFIQFGEDVPQSVCVVDPFNDAALLVERDHGVRADVQLPPP